MEINVYNKIEQDNREKLSNRIIQAFSTVEFEKSGYPSRITNINEINRYHDVMQENRFLTNIGILKKINKDEFDLICKISNLILAFSKKYNSANNGKNVLSRSLIAKRIVDKFVKKGDTILEIGPGCGYFASMSYECGLKYFGLEICQPFYIYQSNFWDFCFQNDYSNFAINKEIKKVNHIPWWEWCSDNIKSFETNLVVANHVLCEMHPNALKYTFKKIINLFPQQANKIVLCEGIGSRAFSSPEHVIYLMKNIGWNLVHTKDNIFIFVHNTSSKSFLKKMSYRNKIDFTYLIYILKYETKDFFKVLYFLFKLIFKKDIYFHKLSIRILSNFSFKQNNLSINVDYISQLKNFFLDEKKQTQETQDEKFLNYINNLS